MNKEQEVIIRGLKYILLKWGSTDPKATEIILDMNKLLTPSETELAEEQNLKKRAKEIGSESLEEKVPITEFNKDMSKDERQYYGDHYDESR